MLIKKILKLQEHKKTVFVFIVIIQLLICIGCFAGYRPEEKVYDLDVDNFQSNFILINNFMDSQESGYYIDNSFEITNDFMSTSQVDLRAGMYKINIFYRAVDSLNAYSIDADNIDFREQLGHENKFLSEGQTCHTTNLWLSRELKNFKVQFHYGGGSWFFVSRVEIWKNYDWRIGTGLLILTFFLLFDGCLLTLPKWMEKFADRKWKNSRMILTMIVLFASLPLFCYYLFSGHDLAFHLLTERLY